MKKILISDYDKTLYTNKESIEINLKEIEKFRKKGNLFAIATGRSFDSFIKKMNLYEIKLDYLILNHGAIVMDNKFNIIKSFSIENEIANQIILEIKKYPSVKRISIFDIKSKKIALEDGKEVNKISIFLSDLTKSEEIVDILKSKFSKYIKVYLTINKHKMIEIIPSNTDKAKAIAFILEKEKINKENVYTIGDAVNDLEMIEKYNGYGMLHSEQIIIDKAKKLYNNVYDLIDDINS